MTAPFQTNFACKAHCLIPSGTISSNKNIFIYLFEKHCRRARKKTICGTRSFEKTALQTWDISKCDARHICVDVICVTRISVRNYFEFRFNITEPMTVRFIAVWKMRSVRLAHFHGASHFA
jgi:hypothetical protein